MASVYEIVTANLVERMEKSGELFWEKGWTLSALPGNFDSKKPYNGFNVISTMFEIMTKGYKTPWFMTFKQIQKHGGRVKKGEPGTVVIFWRILEKEDPETKKKRKIPMLRYYRVWNLDQTEGIEYEADESGEHVPAETFIEAMPETPRFMHGAPAYVPALDTISMPLKSEFSGLDAYYKTLFHEITHWTGAEKRMNRAGVAECDVSNLEKYSYEELVAELGAAFVCAITGVNPPKATDNSAAYLKAWLKRLGDNPTWIVKAAKDAQAAVQWMKGAREEEETFNTEEDS